MLTEAQLRETLTDDIFEWLVEMSEDELREVFREIRMPRGIDFRWRIFGTEYEVVSRFNGDSGDDMYCKLKRILSEKIQS
jgi:hypothetical protein